MAATINTNVPSLNAQRNLTASASSLATTMQRLSSGMRVNSAKDDAAGLAIAERMNTQVRGLTVAARNANDGISLAQTAEGALGKLGDMLQRMRELAVQAGNSTNSAADRTALQAEVSQLRDEIDRVAKQTTFNNQKILDGSFAGAVFQIGANSGDTVSVGALTNATAQGLSKIDYAFNASTNTGIASSAITTLAAIATGTLAISVSGSTPIDLGEIAVATTGDERLGQVVEAINRKTPDSGVTAYLTKAQDGTYSIELYSSSLTTNGTAAPVSLTGFTTGTTGIAATTLGATSATGVDTLSVSTQGSAWLALKKVDSAIDQINTSRAMLGAMQSRFESAISNIDNQVENLAASRGRIVDADYAKETANLSRTQILQQAGMAMVAQANQLPQSVLSLLKG
jgi:flagellin